MVQDLSLGDWLLLANRPCAPQRQRQERDDERSAKGGDAIPSGALDFVVRPVIAIGIVR